MDARLGHEKHAGEGGERRANTRNGTTRKTLKATFGELAIDTPRDRVGEFGLPLRKAEWQAHLDWAVKAFRICAIGVTDSTQIHTRICYSEFNDIVESGCCHGCRRDHDRDIAFRYELLHDFERYAYPNEIDPAYDVHMERALLHMVEAARRPGKKRIRRSS